MKNPPAQTLPRRLRPTPNYGHAPELMMVRAEMQILACRLQALQQVVDSYIHNRGQAVFARPVNDPEPAGGSPALGYGTVRDTVADVIRAQGSVGMTLQEIMAELVQRLGPAINKQTIKKTLNRLQASGEVINTRRRWRASMKQSGGN